MINVRYTGAYPNLCSGILTVTVDVTKWEFPAGCLRSGGDVSFEMDGSETVTDGEWSVREWPEGFPEDKKQPTLDAINSSIPHGCCGGCE